MSESGDNNVTKPQQAAADDSPKFGRLLIVLALAVLLMALITFLSEAYYS